MLTGRHETAIEALRRILSPDRVIETHMAHVLLAGDRAYKIRKSVSTQDVDYSSAEARRVSCHVEVAVNRELAPDVYLGVWPLTLSAGAGLELRGAGREVDWVIVMRRLPDARMLDRMLARAEPVPDRALSALADLLGGFYRAHPMAPDEGRLFFDRLNETAHRNSDSLSRWDELVALGALALCSKATQLIDAHRPEIEDRIARRLVVEGHGDLRPEHVCLEETPVVFDRIEFSRALRLVDIYEEIGYLAMECELAGNAAIGPILIDRMRQAGVAPPGPGLMAAYIAHRCLTRARLCIDHLADADVRTPEKWAPLSRRYIAQARKRLAGVA